jgi:hypothetical protein
MSIPMICPSCGSHLNVNDRYAGRGGKCPRCKKHIDIPRQAAMPAPTPKPAPMAAVAIATPTSSEASNAGRGLPRWLLVLLISAGVAGVGLVSIIPITAHLRRSEEQRQQKALVNAKALHAEGLRLAEGKQFETAFAKMSEGIRNADAANSEDGKQLKDTIAADLALIQEEAQRDRRERLAKEAAARKEAEEKAAQEARLRKEREQAEAARQKQLAEAELAQKKAREMYPEYKKSAEDVADQILKFISATESSLTLQDHRAYLQELVFKYNKFLLRCTPTERRYDSCLALGQAVGRFKRAQTLWDLKLKAAGANWYELESEVESDPELKVLLAQGTSAIIPRLKAKLEVDLQAAWEAAGKAYRQAMAALGAGK